MIVLLFSLTAVVVLAQSDATLEFVEAALTLTPKDDNITAMVTVQNQSDEAVTEVEIVPVLLDKNKQPYSGNIEVAETITNIGESCTGEKCIGAGGVAQIALVFPNDLPADVSGHLMIATAEGRASELLTVNMDDGVRAKAFGLLNVSAGLVIWASLFIAMLTFVVCCIWLYLSCQPRKWTESIGGNLGQISWDWKENWLSNVTGLIAVAATVVSLAILPETTALLTKTATINQYTVLAAMFGIGIVVAPLVGAMLTTLWPHEDGQDQTQAWVYVLAVAIVMWAVAGVFLTMHLFFDEIRISKSIDGGALWLIQILLFCLGLMAFAYTVKKTVDSAADIIKPKDAGASAAVPKTVRANKVYLP